MRPLLYKSWIILFFSIAWELTFLNTAYTLEKPSPDCEQTLTKESAAQASSIVKPITKIDEPLGIIQRLRLYKEKVSFQFWDGTERLKLQLPNPFNFLHQIPFYLQKLIPHLNPLSNAYKAKNTDLQGKEGNASNGSNENDDAHVVGKFNKPSVYYFKRQVFQKIYFRSGRNETAPILNYKQRELSLGISSATMHLENIIPGKYFELPIPAGYRVIVQPSGSSVKILRDSSDRYFFRSFKHAVAPIHFSEDRALDLSHQERRIYTTVHEPIELQEWPGNFGILLRALANQVQTQKGLSTTAIAEAVKSLIQNYLLYSETKSNVINTLDMVNEGRCQCDWAALLLTGILRQYFGIPARVIIGDTGSGKSGEGGITYILKSNALHAWVEFYETADRKWHLVDATPTEKERTQASPFWDNLLNALNGDSNAFDQNLNSFYDLAPTFEGTSDLGDFLKRWAIKLQGQNFSGGSGSFDFNFEMPDFFKGRHHRDRPVSELELENNKDHRKQKILYSILESVWQHVLEGSDNTNHLISRAIHFEGYLEVKEHRAKADNDPSLDLYRHYLKRTRALISKITSFGVIYESEGEKIKTLEQNSKQLSMAQLILLVSSQIIKYRTLSISEHNLLRFSRLALARAQPLQKSSSEHQQAFFDHLCEKGRDIALDYELKKKYVNGKIVDLERFWTDYKSGKLDELIEVFRQSYFFPKITLPRPDLKKKETPDLISAPISDEEEDIGRAEDLARYGNFTRKGFGVKYDLFQFTTGLMEERQYKDQSEQLKETFVAPLTAVILIKHNWTANYHHLVLRKIASEILRGANVVLLAMDSSKKVRKIWNPDEILGLNEVEASKLHDFEEAVKELRPDFIHEIYLQNKGERDPHLALDESSPIPWASWEIQRSPFREIKGNEQEKILNFPHWVSDDSSTLKAFKQDLEHITSLKQPDQNVLESFSTFGFISLNPEDLKGTDLMSWRRFKALLIHRPFALDQGYTSPVLAEILKEWETELNDVLDTIPIPDTNIDAFQIRARMRFSELTMNQKLVFFAASLPKPLLKDFLRGWVKRTCPQEIRSAWHAL